MIKWFSGITSISTEFNPYIMFLLSVIAEALGFTLGTCGTNISRRKLLITYYLLAVLPLLGVAMVPINGENESIVKIVLVMLLAGVGKALISVAFYLSNLKNNIESFIF